jgi:Domain of unknown function (DUF1707)
MDDRIRVSDADRERVTARLREHYAEGRLTAEELDERVTAALNAKTFGELRRVMADLPEPELVGPQGGPAAPWAMRPVVIHRGPRLLPLALFVLIAAIVLPGAGFVFFAFLKVLLLIWLVACVAGIFAAHRFRRRVRRYRQSAQPDQWHRSDWHSQ